MGRSMLKSFFCKEHEFIWRTLIGYTAGCMFIIIVTSVAIYCNCALAQAKFFIEHTQSKAPDVKVYVQGAGIDEDSEFEADIKGDTETIHLTQKGETVSAHKSNVPTDYVFLFDNSKSVNKKHFVEAKKQLIDFRKSIKKNDKNTMTLYAIGVAKLSAPKERIFKKASASLGLSKQIKSIKKIKPDGMQTALYRSINECVAEGKTNPKHRTIVVVLTDGVDDANKNNHKKTTEKNVKNSSVPLYGIVMGNTVSGGPSKEERSKINATKSMLNTYNAAGKPMRGIDISKGKKASHMKNAFKRLVKMFDKDTYEVQLKADNNRTVTNAHITLNKLNGKTDQSYPKDIICIDHVSDKAPPEVGDITEESGKKLTFYLTDENGINEDDAMQTANYELYRIRNDEVTQERWDIEDVGVPTTDSDKEREVNITIKNTMYNGDYVLRISGIRDNSQEQNLIAVKTERRFSVAGGLKERTAVAKNLARSYWWIALLVFVIIIGLVIIIIVKKKPGKVVNVEADLNAMDESVVKDVTLKVTDPSGTTWEKEFHMDGSFFVGRTDMCNLKVQDDMLSKQHFVIGITKTGCYIEDLQSTNGTRINGVAVREKRKLNDGDVIQAGRSRIVFNKKDVELIFDEPIS